jgi:multidrug resistance efflux pump
MDLGDLQAPYQSLVQSLQEYRLQHTSSARQAQASYLTQQLKQHERLGQQLARLQDLASQELTLARKRYAAEQLLLANKVIADADADRSQQDYLHAKGAYETAQNNIVNNQLIIIQLQAQQTGLQLIASDQNVQTRDQIHRSLRGLASQIQLWQEHYILTAPVAGVVSFSRLRSDEQFVQVGEEALTLVPRSASYIGQLYLPLAGSGKVKIGQRVNLRFDAYPSAEFGLVSAQVQTIAAVPNDGAYLVQVRLTQGLQTSYHKQLPFRQQIQGQAEIITQDARLIERFLNQIRSLLDRQ